MDSLILFDYVTLRHIWWLLLGVLLIGFAILDGADLGISMLVPAVAKTDDERRVLYNVIGPVWEGNQVWLITAGGVIFAAWPLLYAVSFSGFYLAMMLLLIALIVRPVAIKYRSKIEDENWRRTWDRIWCASGFISALVFGLAVGNVILGVPFHFEPDTLRPIYEGGFLDLFHPFALLCGLLSILLMVMQGAVVLSWKTEGEVARLATRWARYAGLATALVFVIGGFYLASAVAGYTMDLSLLTGNEESNPLLSLKAVTVTEGAWMTNYTLTPWAWVAPVLGVLGALLAVALVGRGRGLMALVMASLSIAGIIFTFGFSTYPFLLPSSTQPNSSLTIFDASASHLSLWVMLLVATVFLPLIITYTSWVYRIMRGKVTADSINSAPHSY